MNFSAANLPQWLSALYLSPYEQILMMRLVLAAFLGAMIGLERDIHGRAAGLRTHLLVSTGSALFMVISESLAVSYPGFETGTRGADPARIAAQVVSGIGFLGAGAIIKEGLSVRGLTTASCLWIVAAIGLATGAGLYSLAIATTALSLVALVGLTYFERSYRKDSYREITIETSNSVDIAAIVAAVKRIDIAILRTDFKRDFETNLLTVTMALRLFNKGGTDITSGRIIKSLQDHEVPLRSIRWESP